MPDAAFDGFLQGLRGRWSWLPADLAHRYARAYGTRADRLLAGANGINDLGLHFGDDLYSREVNYLIDQEWAMTAADVLWRRSNLGRHLAPATVAALESWFGPLPDRRRAGAS